MVRQKIKKFFDELQNNAPIIEIFSEESFQRSISIPYYKLIRTGRNYIVQLAVAPELYNQKYPFKLPEKFLFYENSYDLRIKLKIIEILSQSDIEKQFFFKEFLDHQTVSNTKKTYIQHKIIELLLELENERVINSNFIFVDKNNHVKKLNSLNNFDMKYFTQLHYIYFYENLIIDKI